MTLARRLLAGSLVVVTLLVLAVVVIAGRRLRDRLVDDTTAELGRDARMVALEWRRDTDADALAHQAGAVLGYRVTLVDSTGVVVGDAEFTPDARHQLQNHATRPEILRARVNGIGSARGHSPFAEGEELYVAVRHPLGFVRVSITTRNLDEIVSAAQRDVLEAGLVALLGALILAYWFSRAISRPIVELRDSAQRIAAGDLTQRPTLNAPGEIGDLATALHRMAEQLRARLDALEADDRLMTAVLESLEEGVLAVDERGVIVHINSRARALLAVSAPVPFPRELLPREHTLRAALEDALDGDGRPAAETQLYERTVAIGSRRLAPRGGVVTLLDLTVLRRLEVIRRDFVANVSHELRTPLTAVSGYAETLLDADIPEPQRRQFVETIRDNAGRMQRIVDDLLDLSRIESGGWRPHVRVMSVEGMVRDVFTSLEARATSKGLRLVADIPETARQVHADPTALRQVLTNLVENAVRYTAEGSVTVRSRAADDGGVWIDVQDTGVGISAAHLPRIFERFYRADPGRARDSGGTGLGLAIVRHLVEAHGGRVEAASEPGRGTTISVFFPAREEA